MSVTDTSDRYASRERMVVWDAGELPATSEKWGFLGVLVYARGDSLAENRAM